MSPLEHGPLDYWSPDKPPTPTQWRAIALQACKLLGLREPTHRLDATTTLVRLQLADEAQDAEVPEPW